MTTLPASRAALGRAVVLLGGDVAALLHEAAPVVPEAVVQGQLVLQLLRLLHAGVRVLPLERCQPGAGQSQGSASKRSLELYKMVDCKSDFEEFRAECRSLAARPDRTFVREERGAE